MFFVCLFVLHFKFDRWIHKPCLHTPPTDTICLCNMNRGFVTSAEAIMSVSAVWKPSRECLLLSLTAHWRYTRSALMDVWKSPCTYWKARLNITALKRSNAISPAIHFGLHPLWPMCPLSTEKGLWLQATLVKLIVDKVLMELSWRPSKIKLWIF